MSLASSDPHKLDLMAENSSLKVKLAKAEKSLRDSDERLGIAQVCLKDLFEHVSMRNVLNFIKETLVSII